MMQKRSLLPLTIFFLLLCPRPTLGVTRLPMESLSQHSEGEFQSWVDRRDLLVMHHPWVPSATGGYCEATATVSIPSDLKPPLRLSLYQSDNYFNDFWRAHNDSWLGGDGFLGHRFKQVWADDILLWESDVADGNPPQVSGELTLDLPESILGSKTFTLSLKLVDKVSTWIQLASDTQHISTTEVAAEKPGDPAKYWTHVYWGDIQILSGTEEPEPGMAPAQKRLRERAQQGLPSPVENPFQPPYSLRLSCSAPLPQGGFPVRCGIPLSKGYPGKTAEFQLIEGDGRVVPSHFEDLTPGVRGWRKWVSAEFIALPDMKDSELEFRESTRSANGPPLFSRPIRLPQGTRFFPGRVSDFKTCQAGTELHFASCEIRFDPDHTLELTDLPLIDLEGEPHKIRLGYSNHVETVTKEFDALTVECPSWIVVDIGDQHHFVSLRWIEGTEATRFKIVRDGTKVRVALLPYFMEGRGLPYPATIGEAKTFEILYCRFDGDDPEENYPLLASNFNRPPLLINTAVLGKTGVWGEALPPSERIGRELIGFLDASCPDPLGASFQWGNKLRDYGDIIYQGTDSWRNGYYDVRQGFAAAYLISGSREWADALDRYVRHTLDVDTIHWSADHPDQVSLPHGYGENHTSMEPWNPIVRANGLFAAAHLWANTEYYQDALKMAKQAAHGKRALGAVSVRDHAGVLMSLAVAYRETGDPLFKEACEKMIEDIANNRIDARRGTYPEVHGNWNYRGNVPWMVAQLMEPLYIYYRESGDLRAASLLVGMADSILAENQTRGVPGDIHGYSHNPHFQKRSDYHVLIAPCLFYAYELTGDESFKEAAVAAWEQTVREATINSVLNCFWNTPTLVYYLTSLRYSK